MRSDEMATNSGVMATPRSEAAERPTRWFGSAPEDHLPVDGRRTARAARSWERVGAWRLRERLLGLFDGECFALLTSRGRRHGWAAL